MSSTIQAIPDYKGTLIPGTNNSLLFTLTDFDGNPLNATDIEVNIYNASSTLVLEAVPERPTDGFYVYEWYISATQTNGAYYAHWTYTVDDTTATEIQELVIGADPSKDSTIYSGVARDLRTILEYYIPCAMHIPVYFEQARPSRDQKTFKFTFDKWNQTPSIRMYRNKKELLVDENLSVNYFDGKVIFTNAQTDYDRLFVDYNFRWFSDEQLYAFLVNAVNSLNTQPPFSPQYNLSNVPTIWYNGVIKHAAADALRAMMLCLNFQEPRQVFGEDVAQSIFSQLETLKKNYEEEWKTEFDRKKLGPYPKLYIVDVPEYTLPGGRSLCPTTTYVTTKVGTNKQMELPYYKIYKLFKQGNPIEVMSRDTFGRLCFAPVKCVFESGTKEIYELKTRKGFSIKTSKEHLFFVDNTYLPLEDIKVGSVVRVIKHGKLQKDRVISIRNTGKVTQMYDMDIPSTRNLFTNGIQTHNSRWFRYLFSGSS